MTNADELQKPRIAGLTVQGFQSRQTAETMRLTRPIGNIHNISVVDYTGPSNCTVEYCMTRLTRSPE